MAPSRQPAEPPHRSMHGTIRHDIRHGSYRILVREDQFDDYIVEMLQEREGYWYHIRGPFRYADLERAVALAGELKESLQERV